MVAQTGQAGEKVLLVKSVCKNGTALLLLDLVDHRVLERLGADDVVAPDVLAVDSLASRCSSIIAKVREYDEFMLLSTREYQ